MMYTTAATLMPMALAATNNGGRSSTDLQFEISDFEARCMAGGMYSGGVSYCVYDIVPLDNTVDSYYDDPYYGMNCGTKNVDSDHGDLPALKESDCGSFRIAVTKSDDGGLVLSVSSPKAGNTGRFVIPAAALTRTTEGPDEDDDTKEQTVQKYTGPTSFTIHATEDYAEPARKSSTDIYVVWPTTAPSSDWSSSSPTAVTFESSTTVTSTSSPQPSTTGAST
ncbi:hypothetical protein PG994_005256 [Apiospora phragmitis]|uniref:Uncharacterized protein n=1 Tax=Apiospora phragmitis TaxID=2905665 RepID=A0ABR1VT17_9PEZI